MLWRNSILLLVPLLLMGCGFKPVYSNKAEHNGTSKVLAGVSVETIPGRMGQLFKENLEDRLNPGGAMPAKPEYRLVTTLTSVTQPIGVSRDGTVSRYNVYLDSDYKLFRIADNTMITTGRLRHVSSYNNITNVYFSTYISEQDANKHGVEELSELYRHRLAAYLDAGAPLQLPADTGSQPSTPSMPINPWNNWNNQAVGR
jgi:hypothetical protein